jgi:hypothetical protein
MTTRRYILTVENITPANGAPQMPVEARLAELAKFGRLCCGLKCEVQRASIGEVSRCQMASAALTYRPKRGTLTIGE